ncbi:MAG: uroporphyrinogen-III synthase [Bacteroidales bacterium]|nr:uroporphyrinogen-III synthase [Bacteroidales bacterium]
MAKKTLSTRIKSVLISQPAPQEGEKSPYKDLAEKFNFDLNFRKFIKIEGVPAKEFRKERINLLDYSAVILTSKNAVDHYFRMAKEMRVEIPIEMKYLCTSEATALYMQNYVQYRKRKIFFPKNQSLQAMMDLIHKHRTENYLFPTSNVGKTDLPKALEKSKYKVTKSKFYRTVPDDVSDLKITKFDMLVFFSPIEIKSLLDNFPKFRQAQTVIATFGSATAEAVEKAGLKLQISAPTPEFPSMTAAIDAYLTALAKAKK